MYRAVVQAADRIRAVGQAAARLALMSIVI